MPAPKKHFTDAQLHSWQASLGLVFPNKPLLRPDEISGPLDVDLRTVNRLFEVQGTPEEKRPWLMGLEFSAGALGDRMTRRINRDAVVLFWAHSANHEPGDILALFLDALERRTDHELLTLVQRAHLILKRRSR